MKQDNDLKVIKPFGPSIARAKMPEDLIINLNNYIEETISDKKKIDKLNHGNNLAGSVTQEFKLEKDLIASSGYEKFLSESVYSWLKYSGYKNVKNFNIISTWIVRQFKNEYNPTHWHGGHISCAGFLKLPKNLGKHKQPKENR